MLMHHSNPSFFYTSYVYDGLNRLVKESNGVDADITYTYDSLGQLSKVQRGESYISYSYDGIGQVVSEKSENGEKRYSYDKVGNLTEKYIYDKMGVELESSYTYDVLSRVTGINIHMGKEVLSYDKAGRITKSENTSTGESIRYWYNRDNTVSKVIHSWIVGVCTYIFN